MLGSEGVIAQDTWNGLTEEQQIVLVEASKIASAYNKEISAARELEVLKQLREEGYNVIEITDKSPWKEAAQRIIIKRQCRKMISIYGIVFLCVLKLIT